ncbi:MAG TPA: peptidylprolyl isomerase [Parvibaculum sp.]
MKPEKFAGLFLPAGYRLFRTLPARILAGIAAVSFAGFLAVAPAHAEDALQSLLNPAPQEAAPAPQPDASQGIAAVVNDKIISRYDLEQRVKLIMATSGIPNTPENVSRIEPQVLRALVDEALEMQEAKRLDVKVEQSDINKELDSIAKRANMSPAEIDAYLKHNGVSKSSLVDQIQADIAWNKVIGQQFGALISVGEDEIDDVLKRLKEESDQPRYLVSEILLTFDNPSQEQEMMGGAQRLADQIRQGAPFASVARQFSQSPSSANGGDIGWVHASQLPEEIAPTVEKMDIGAVSDPIKTLNGVYIVQLRNKQTGLGPDPMHDQWTLIHILLPLTPDAPQAAVARRATETTKFVNEFKSCDGVQDQIKAYVGGVAGAAQTVTFGELDAKLRAALSNAKPGQILTPIRSAQGIEMVAVCGHKADDTSMPTRDAIEDNLFSQQLSMMARRHLRDLRRDAVVEIR